MENWRNAAIATITAMDERLPEGLHLIYADGGCGSAGVAADV